MKRNPGTGLDAGGIAVGNTAISAAGEVGVDVKALMRDIFALSPAEIESHLARTGVDVEVIHGAEAPGDKHNGYVSPVVALPYLDMRNDLELKAELDKLVAFSQDLSVHTAKSKNAYSQYQKYIELLLRIAPLLPEEYQKRIRAFNYPDGDSSSREALLASLSKAGLLPKEIIDRLEAHNAKSGSKSMLSAETLNYSVLMSYKKEFESLRNAGNIAPQSEKVDITNQESLEYTREVFSHALNALRKYLYSPNVWKLLESKYGQDMMKWTFMDYENLESGFLKRIYLAEKNMPTSLDYDLFYNSFIAIVDRLNGVATTH